MGPSTMAFLKRVYARAKAASKVHVEHHGGVVVLGHAPERGVHGDRRRVPEPHHHPRPHHESPRRGAAATPRPQPRAAHGVAPANSRSAVPKGLSCPVTTARSQSPQVAWEPVSSLTGRPVNTPMLSALSICQHDLRTQSLVPCLTMTLKLGLNPILGS